ncbi:DUF4243 domain-containing protein [Leptospira wolffii]|nr:DUF4243 domain-containing protein [Leptospira wolffii]
MTSDFDFDSVLDFLQSFGPDLKNGLSNHAPMATEALFTMGRTDAIFPWLERYEKELKPKEVPTREIGEESWPSFLGASGSFPEWEIFFKNEIRTKGWQKCVSYWIPKLSPGICADATHGVIRTGHSIRNLIRKETSLRLGEFSSGLAVWASNYLELPTSFESLLGLSARDALQKVSFVPPEKKVFSGTIVSSLEGLKDVDSFAPVIGYWDAYGEEEKSVSELTEAFSRVLKNNVEDTLSAIVFVHSVTSISALRSILPFLTPFERKSVLRYSWQTSVALYSAFGKNIEQDIYEPIAESREEAIEKAIQHGDEHAIKFTEVCLKENELAPSSSYFAALQAARTYLEPLS